MQIFSFSPFGYEGIADRFWTDELLTALGDWDWKKTAWLLPK